MATQVYEYEKCSTCRNALKWLDKNGISYSKTAIVENPPTAGELKSYVAKSGLPLKKFFNTSGLVYREMKLGEKLSNLSESEQLKLLASNGKLIKRPLLVDAQGVLVGFNEKEYREHFKK